MSKTYKGILRDLRVNNIDLFSPLNHPNKLSKTYRDYYFRTVYSRMGYTEFSFIGLILSIGSIVSLTGYFVTKIFCGRKYVLLDNRTEEQYEGNKFGNNISNMNPNNKFIPYIGRYTTDPYCFSRILPKDAERYFTKEKLKEISYISNNKYKDLNNRYNQVI